MLDRIIYYACHVDVEGSSKEAEKGNDKEKEKEKEEEDESEDDADDDEEEGEHPMVTLERCNTVLQAHASFPSKSEQLFTRVIHLLLLAVDKAPQSDPGEL